MSALDIWNKESSTSLPWIRGAEHVIQYMSALDSKNKESSMSPGYRNPVCLLGNEIQYKSALGNRYKESSTVESRSNGFQGTNKFYLL